MFSHLALIGLLALQPQVPSGDVSLVDVQTRPQKVRTGQRFQLVLRVRTSPDLRAVFPDSLPAGEGYAPAGAMTIRFPDSRGGAPGYGDEAAQPLELEVTYPLQWFRPGRHRLPPLRVRLEAMGQEEGSGREESLREWLLLSPGFVEVLPVLPPGQDGLDPRGPVQVELSVGSKLPALPILSGFLGVALLGLGLRASGRNGSTKGPSPSGPPENRPTLSPQEAASRLRTLLRDALEEDPPDRSWEEALFLFRVALQPDTTREATARTTSEILSSLEGELEGRRDSLRCILEEGDRLRFAPGESRGNRPGQLMNRIREWTEAGGV